MLAFRRYSVPDHNQIKKSRGSSREGSEDMQDGKKDNESSEGGWQEVHDTKSRIRRLSDQRMERQNTSVPPTSVSRPVGSGDDDHDELEDDTETETVDGLNETRDESGCHHRRCSFPAVGFFNLILGKRDYSAVVSFIWTMSPYGPGIRESTVIQTLNLLHKDFESLFVAICMSIEKDLAIAGSCPTPLLERSRTYGMPDHRAPAKHLRARK
ncbi:hypothetical protein V8E55_005776 [Tylopilus felleus]